MLPWAMADGFSTQTKQTMQLTLLSIVVALVLENLTGQVSDPAVDWQAATTWLQAALLVVTLVSMWAGLSLTVSFSKRAIQAVDFLYPFGLLLFLSIAATSLSAENTVRFFLCLGIARLFGIWALITDALSARRAGYSGPVVPARMQTAAATVELIAAAVLALVSSSIWVIVVAASINIVLESVLAAASFRGWADFADGEPLDS